MRRRPLALHLRISPRHRVGALALGTCILLGGCGAEQRTGLQSRRSETVPTRVVAATSSAGAPRPASAPSASSAPSVSSTAADPRLLAGYALDEPDAELELPRELAEISGVTDISATEVACVEDEHGLVFFYDLATREVTRRLPFADHGDYEGLTRVGDDLYVLRSDGTLYEIRDFRAARPQVLAHDAGMPTRDNEGLCYDPFASRILVAPKSRPDKATGDRRTQALFTYDPKVGRVAPEPSVILDVDAVHDGRPREKETKHGKRRVLPTRFLPSAVAVHPKTGDLFVISAVAQNLVVFDRDGKPKAQHELDPERFPQPEGLTFLPDGTLVVASEGTQRGKLLLFHARTQRR